MTLNSQLLKADFLSSIFLWNTTLRPSWLILQQSCEIETSLAKKAHQHAYATVVDLISPEQVGHVKYQGSWWRAISEDDDLLLPSTLVLVTGRIGLTLIVKSAFAEFSY
jgi:membrane protein implicated in regulation of membrane protease activity